MGKKLVSRTAKVLSETKKSRDKEAVAVAYEHIPRNPEEQKHGFLYAVIELEDSAGHAEQIAERIIDILHNEYYDDLDREPLTSFEAALAKINEELAERSSEGQINWLGKLNAVLGVLSENMLHLTQAGKAEAYLYRNDHAMHVTEDLAGDSINPLRTFMNIASGELTEKDRVALVTPGIFYKLSKTELKQYVNELAPKVAVENLSKILSGETGSTLPNAILILEMLSPEAFSQEEEPEAEVWVKEDRKPLEPLAEETLTGAVKTFDFLGKAFSNTSTFLSATAAPKMKAGAKKVSDKLRGFKKDKEAQRIILDSEERISERQELDLEENESILEPNEDFAEREIRIRESKKPSILSLERFNFSFLKTTKNKFTNLKGPKLPRGKFSFIYLGVGLALLLSLGGFLVFKNIENGKRVAAENILNQAKTKYEAAGVEIAQNQRSLAIEDLVIAEKLANEAKDKKYTTKEAEALLSQITALKEQAMGVVKNTAAVAGDFGLKVDNLVTDGKMFYGIKYSPVGVYAFDPKTSKVTTISENSIDSEIVSSTLVTSRKTIVAYTVSNEVYEIDLVSKKTKKMNVSGGIWEKGIALASYFSNIYLLSPENNQIYKHTRTSSGYGKKVNYLSDTADVQGTVGLAIDSNIYTVTREGQVSKYTSGKNQAFTLSNLPRSLSDVSLIYADAKVNGIYLVTESGSVIKLDENGSFLAEYKSDTIKTVQGISVNDTTKTISVLSEGKIYSIIY